MTTEYAWLIEMKMVSSEVIVYYGVTGCKGSMLGFVTDPNKALRFAREQDAQAMIDDYRWNRCRAVQHAWCDDSTEHG